MAKFSKKLIRKIIALIEEDAYTTTSICKIVGISTKSFYEWRTTKPDFARDIDAASERREEELRTQARHALRSKLKGHTQIVSRTVYVPSEDDPSQLVIKQHVVTEKQCAPDTATINQALNNVTYGKTTDNRTFESRSRLSAPPLAIQVDKDKIANDLRSLENQQTHRASIENENKTDDNRYEEECKEETKEAKTKTGQPEKADTEKPIKKDESITTIDDLQNALNKHEYEAKHLKMAIKQMREQESKNKWQPTPCLPPPLRGRAYRFRG